MAKQTANGSALLCYAMISSVQKLTQVVSPPPPHQKKSFLSMFPFFRRALEVPFLKDVTKNVHEN